MLKQVSVLSLIVVEIDGVTSCREVHLSGLVE